MDEKTEKKARMLAMVCHLSGLSAFLGIPFGNVLGPLILWKIFKKDYPFVEDQGKEALNFQLSMCVYALAASLLTLIYIGYWLIAILLITVLALAIIASMKAFRGEAYRYPFNFRFIK